MAFHERRLEKVVRLSRAGGLISSSSTLVRRWSI